MVKVVDEADFDQETIKNICNKICINNVAHGAEKVEDARGSRDIDIQDFCSTETSHEGTNT